ncbi:MAG: Radical domain protein [Actinomycetospora sp.]|nr:Radical domain protein [Actinomycetospora sp.]
MKLVDHFVEGLTSPICLTWELTYACNLSCVHCLSSSGRRDPDELSTDEAKAVIDELQRMQVFYVNIGGGEPTVRSDFWESTTTSAGPGRTPRRSARWRTCTRPASASSRSASW